MKVKVFYPDRNDRISFSKKELEELLDEVYREGYSDGRNSVHYWTYTTPNWYYNTNTITTASTRLNDITYGSSTAGDSGLNGYTSNNNTTSADVNSVNTSYSDITNVDVDLSTLKYSVEYK